MNGFQGNRWILAALTAGLVAVAAVVAYNIGLSHGLAQVGAAASGGPAPYPYGWHRSWGGRFLFPLMFIFFWVVMLRALYWRPWGLWGWSHYGPPPSFRDRFDDWHRQAHKRMDKER